MILNILFVVVGASLVLWGADRLTDGSVSIAEKMGVPQIIIGLTIVAFGTSMPEFFSSLVSALKGHPGMAVGNVVGSNIFNALLIVGMSAVVAPMTILKSTVQKDIPFALIASAVLLMMCHDEQIQWYDSVMMLVLFGVFMFQTLHAAMQGREEAKVGGKQMTCLMAAVWIVVGLACLIGGSTLFVDGASDIATSLGVDPAVVGLTVVAMGTSLPELATSVVSARRGNSGIAIGNVLGSNVFNILLILGVTGIVSPLSTTGLTMTDFSVMVVSMILIWLFSYTKYTIERWEGSFLIAIFIGYMAWLIASAV